LEARILADTPLGEIALRSMVPEVVIAVYETLFFDVRQHLTATDWIRSFVICPPRLRNQGYTLRQAVLQLAFAGGPLVAECLIAELKAAIGLRPGSEFEDSTRWRCRRSLALLMRPVDERTMAKHLRMHARRILAKARLEQPPDGPLVQRSREDLQDWPEELVKLAWQTIEERVKAEFVHSGSIPRREAA
jgi:hypothetical protein